MIVTTPVMAIHQTTAAETYRCPDCHGEIKFADRAWRCTDCRYVPRHSAD